MSVLKDVFYHYHANRMTKQLSVGDVRVECYREYCKSYYTMPLNGEHPTFCNCCGSEDITITYRKPSKGSDKIKDKVVTLDNGMRLLLSVEDGEIRCSIDERLM